MQIVDNILYDNPTLLSSAMSWNNSSNRDRDGKEGNTVVSNLAQDWKGIVIDSASIDPTNLPSQLNGQFHSIIFHINFASFNRHIFIK